MITLLAPRGTLSAGATIVLEEAEQHHLRVRRGAADQPVRLVDGAGMVAVGRVTGQGKSSAVLVERTETVAIAPPLVLALGGGDKARFAAAVEKAVELGAGVIVPVETERSLAVTTRVRESSLGRLERRAWEALKQCGGAWLPRLEPPISLAEFLTRETGGARWVAEQGGAPAPPLSPTEPVTVLVGPEGGFTETERQQIHRAGFHPVGLGPHVQRFDTAAVAALTTAWQARERGRHG